MTGASMLSKRLLLRIAVTLFHLLNLLVHIYGVPNLLSVWKLLLNEFIWFMFKLSIEAHDVASCRGAQLKQKNLKIKNHDEPQSTRSSYYDVLCKWERKLKSKLFWLIQKLYNFGLSWVRIEPQFCAIKLDTYDWLRFVKLLLCVPFNCEFRPDCDPIVGSWGYSWLCCHTPLVYEQNTA